LAAGLMFVTPAVPLLFMGEEYGDTAPFLFFTSFLDRELSERVRRGRLQELSRFGWKGRIPDPGAPATFVASQLNHALAAAPRHRALREYYRRWLALRRGHPALGARNKNLTRVALDAAVLTVTRATPAGEEIRLIANLGADPCGWSLPDTAWRLLIVTGFTVRPEMPETDGPPGAAVLGRALRLLGARVRYVTDRVNAPIVGAALATLGEPPDVVVCPDGKDVARGVLDAERPTCLVAIERPGRNHAGDYLSRRGESVAAWNAPLDALFMVPSRATTIGIGDGGNEIGMGVVRARLRRLGPLATRIASVVAVDH